MDEMPVAGRIGDQPGPVRKKRRVDIDSGPTRRSSNACHRCKSKKIKCHHGSGTRQNTCTACARARSDCVFDVTPDGIPRGGAYVAALESRINSLEAENDELRGSLQDENTFGEVLSPVGTHRGAGGSDVGPHDASPPVSAQVAGWNTARSAGGLVRNTKPAQKPAPDITVFNLAQSGRTTAGTEVESLPELPAIETANILVDRAYLHTQARYCIVDWVQLRKWHHEREATCFVSTEADMGSQTGAYFVWMIYAIGAQLAPSPDHSSIEYFARASQYLHAVLSQQNLITVQALLTLIQYNFRASGGPSLWHLVGATLRICVELGYHRKVVKSTSGDDPSHFTIELRKRFFWCTYCFDRLVSLLSKRPFGISDLDIDVEIPVDMDVTCTDEAKIQALQIRQEDGEAHEAGSITTLSAALHHLSIYRIRSNIITKCTGPHALPPSYEDITQFLSELEKWRRQAPRPQSPATFPQQSDERVQATYYQAALLLIRPVLGRTGIDSSLLQNCADLSADACENAKVLSLSPQTHNSRITVYNCFRCGITLLQCLAVLPTVLPLRRTLRAISSCSSALAVYTRTLPAAAPFLQLFEKLSDQFLGEGDESSMSYPHLNLRSVLQKMTLSDPLETLEILRSLSDDETRQCHQSSPAATVDPTDQAVPYDFMLGADSMSTLGMDLLMPFEIFSDISEESHQNMMNFWTGPY